MLSGIGVESNQMKGAHNVTIQFYLEPPRDICEDQGPIEPIDDDNVKLYSPSDLYVCVADLLPLIVGITKYQYYDNEYLEALQGLEGILLPLNTTDVIGSFTQNRSVK